MNALVSVMSFVVGVACWGVADAASGSTVNDSRTRAAPYVAAVRQFAEQALSHGRDTYGKPTPLFVDGINVDTHQAVTWKWADGKEWVLCNLTTQQGLFGTLDGLTRLTGDPSYKDAAIEALRYAFNHLRYGTENNGGLLAWGNCWGDIGETPRDKPALRLPEGASDPYMVLGLLELHRAGRSAAFLEQAQAIGQNILEDRVQQGWFVPSKRHLFCRLSNNESQALLHLAAALLGKPDSVPAFTVAAPFFHAAYDRQTARSYDSALIYARVRP